MKIRNSKAFTLVELLVVITIIAILAGLATVGVMSAMNAARNTRIKFEVAQLDAAMKSFKQQYGSYPPCDLRTPATNNALKAFVSRVFPRYNQASLAADLANAGVDTVNFRPDQALVFWLSGFNPDITHPFSPGPRSPLYEFDKTRLLNPLGFTDTNANGNWDAGEPGLPRIYWPQDGMKAPYVYFDSRSYGNLSAANPYTTSNTLVSSAGAAGSSAVVPYAQDVNGDGTTDSWANAESFQIICAGQDGLFGAAAAPTQAKLYPVGLRYASEDKDNITNFNDRATLEDAMP